MKKETSEQPTHIGIPLGTRLIALTMHNGCIHIWTAIRCRPLDYSKWQGTYLQIEPDGCVTRVTRDTAHEPDYMELVIKESDG